MTFSEAIQTCMGKYATFEGRASRSEFWWFYLFGVLMSWAATLVGAMTLPRDIRELPSLMVNLAFLLPAIASGARRLHDTGRSGWWQLLMFTLVGFIPLVIWWSSESQAGANRFGESPAR